MTNKIVFFVLVLLISTAYSQHRGDAFFYQGLTQVNDGSAATLGRGSAFNAESGDINSVFFNPAGLAGLKSMQVSYFSNRDFRLWRENQDYRPNTFLVTLPLYLEGYYIPRKQNNGKEDNLIYIDDSTYNITDPKLGLDPFSEEAAGWQKTMSYYTPLNFAIAVPLNEYVNGLSVAAAFTQSRIVDYDRNDTYLNPHIGYSFYNPIVQANGIKQVSVNWFRYYRQREGTLSNIHVAAAYKVSDEISVGANVNYIFGKSDDNLGLNKFGSFLIMDQNMFSFAYERYRDTTYGTSNYSALSLKLGANITFSKFTIGIIAGLPYTFNRKVDYTNAYSWRVDRDSMIVKKISGTDKLKMPFYYSIGINYTPKPKITLAADLDYRPYGNAVYELVQKDSTFQNWVNQLIVKFGIEYQAFNFLTLRAGYRTIPQSFVPDGAAIKDEGPVTKSYTFGFSIMPYNGASIDFAYEFRNLQYYDQYYSNTNYNTDAGNKFSLGYTFNF